MNTIFKNIPKNNISDCFNFIFKTHFKDFEKLYLSICNKTNDINFNKNTNNNFILFGFIFIIYFFFNHIFIFINLIENKIIIIVKNIINVMINIDFIIEYLDIKNIILLFNQYKLYFDDWIKNNINIHYNIIKFLFDKLHHNQLLDILNIYNHLSSNFNINFNINLIDNLSYKILWKNIESDSNLNNLATSSILNFINNNLHILHSYNNLIDISKPINLEFNNIISILNLFNIDYKHYKKSKLPVIFLKLLFHLIISHSNKTI